MQTKLMTLLGPRYTHRQEGYTRVMKLAAPRAGDKADMSVLEYVDRPGEIRAARPPSSFSTSSLTQVLEELGVKAAAELEIEEGQAEEATDKKV
jgi:hypothetical protein